MNRILIVCILVTFSFWEGFAQDSFYDYTVKTLEGEDYPLSQLKGKKVMVVNTASKCGLTPQYEQLEELFKEYGGDDFVIVGFPANNFMKQEPGSADEIREFCSQNYGVTFPMMAKVSVKGADIAPIYQWLTHESQNNFMDSDVKWNFQKYLIDEKGQLVKVISPRVKPDDKEIVDWIKGQ